MLYTVFIFSALKENSLEAINTGKFFSDISYTDRSLKNHVTITKRVNSLTECFRLCFECRMDGNCSCLSANFSRYKVDNEYKCEINNGTHFNNGEDFVHRIGFQYYELIQE